MVLLIDTAMVPARERLDFWLESSSDAVSAGARPQHGEGAVRRAHVGLRLRPDQLLPDRRRGEHDDAHAAGDRGLRPGMPAPDRRPARPDRGRAGGQDGDRRDRRRDQLRDVAPGGLPGGRAVRVARRAGAEEPARPGCGRGSAAAPRSRIPGGEGLPRAAVAFFRGLVCGLEDGTITPDDAPNTVECVVDLVRGMYAVPARASGPKRLRSRAEILLDIQIVHRREPRRPRSGSGRDRPRELHLDALPPQAVRGRGDERVPVDPHVPAGALPPRSARSGSQPLTILAIASRWGLPGPQHFSRLFREAYGCSPSEMRRRAALPHRRTAVTPVLQATGISVSFGGVHAVVDVDLDVGAGPARRPDRAERRRQDDLHRRDQRLRPRERPCRARRRRPHRAAAARAGAARGSRARGSRSSCSTT